MICLAVNTANSIMSAAILRDDGTVLYHFKTSETRDQGNLLIGHIEQGLETANLSYDDIHLLAVVTGPGSFTGIRIGISAMRGFALAMRKPLIGISSFDLYETNEETRDNLIVVESFRDELYIKAAGQEPVNMSPETFAAQLPDTKEWIVSGDATDKIMPFLNENCKKTDYQPDAIDVARLAIKKYNQEPESANIRPEPFYLREADVSVSTKIRPVTIV